MTKKERIKKRKEVFNLLSEGFEQKQAALKVGVNENTITVWLRHQKRELDPIQKAIKSTIHNINTEFRSENVSLENIKEWSTILKLFKDLERQTIKSLENQ